MEDKLHDYVLQTLHESGIDATDNERIADVTAESVEPFAEQMGIRIADRVIRDRKSFRVNSKIDRAFNKRLQRRYRSAFKMYNLAAACALEAGEAVATRPSESLDDEQQATLFALAGIHAKGCRVVGEVYALLINGFPDGALARCRTLHEMAVIAGALADCAGDSTHGDLAIRYLEHEVIDARRSALQYQQDYAALGNEPLEQEYIDELEDRYNDVIARYGPDFKRDYGWAKEYCADDNLAGIERKLQMGHMRGYYKLASNEVHAGSRGVLLNNIDFRGQATWRAGKTNIGLTEPASMALNSLYQITVMLLINGHPESRDLAGLVTLKALDELRVRAENLFLESAAAIHRDEEEVRKSLSL